MATLRYGAPEEAGMSPGRIENLRRLGARWVEDGTHPALVLLVARRGVVVLHEAWGKQGPEPDAPPASVDSIFALASLSKIIAAACVMLLVEEGTVGLNRPIQEYIPEFRGEGKEDVLVHHLLTHSSGLRDDDVTPQVIAVLTEEAGDGFKADQEQSDVADKILDVIFKAPLSFQPGSLMSYSTIAGYALLSELVQRISGSSLEAFARTRLFEPLGMVDTSYLLSDSDRPRLVRRPPGHVMLDWIQSIVGRVLLGAGSVTSTALDMAKFGQMFLNGGDYNGARVLGPATVREMTRNQIPGVSAEYIARRVDEASWGYGWGITGFEKWQGMPSLLSPPTYWHTGGSGVALYVDPQEDLICAYFPILVGEGPGLARHWDLFVNAAVAAIVD